MKTIVIVGAGIAGSILARRLAEEENKQVLIVEKRNYIGGYCYDYRAENDILIHKHGPHIFRTVNRAYYKIKNCAEALKSTAFVGEIPLQILEGAGDVGKLIVAVDASHLQRALFTEDLLDLPPFQKHAVRARLVPPNNALFIDGEKALGVHEGRGEADGEKAANDGEKTPRHDVPEDGDGDARPRGNGAEDRHDHEAPPLVRIGHIKLGF